MRSRLDSRLLTQCGCVGVVLIGYFASFLSLLIVDERIKKEERTLSKLRKKLDHVVSARDHHPAFTREVERLEQELEKVERLSEPTTVFQEVRRIAENQGLSCEEIRSLGPEGFTEITVIGNEPQLETFLTVVGRDHPVVQIRRVQFETDQEDPSEKARFRLTAHFGNDLRQESGDP